MVCQCELHWVDMIGPALGNACSFVRTHISASVAVCSKQLKALLLEALHVLQLEVSYTYIQWHGRHMGAGEVDGAWREVVLAQPLLRQVVEAALQNSMLRLMQHSMLA